MSDHIPVHELADDIAKKLLCLKCDGYVSCGPVMMHPDGASICGRCSSPDDDGCLRNTLYESAMSKFSFPCRYSLQGCNQRVLFDNTVEHENRCLYRTYPCPSLPHSSCPEKVSTFDIWAHFKQNHPDLITEDGKIILSLQKNFQKNFLMVVDGIPVIIQYDYNLAGNILCVDVGYFFTENQPDVFYKIQITSVADAECSLQFKECQGRMYESCSINQRNAMSFELINYLPSLNNPLSIHVAVLPRIVYVSSSNVKSVQNAFDALETVRCFHCNEYCVSSVFEGISRTDNLNVLACKNCSELVRNSVEKMIEDLIYPCYWKGCTFMGNKDNILKHMEECVFKSYICRIDWCQKGFFTWNSVLSHMSNHGVYCPDPKSIVIKLLSDETAYPTKKVYFAIVKKNILTVICTKSENGIWSLEFKCDGFVVCLYFEHDHCRNRTKTYSASDNFVLKNDSEGIANIFPYCYKICKRIEAIIEFKER